MHPPRVFLLSPARLDGVRGRRILAGEGTAACTARLARGEAVPLCTVYAHISSLYFRGKWTYARTFHRPGTDRPVSDAPAGWVITSTRGLVPGDLPVTREDLEAFAREDISPDNPAYLEPLTGSAERLRTDLGNAGEAVLLGSIATARYVEPLEAVLGDRLAFPRDFAGRGDMSRGGLLLRAAASGRELAYVPVRDGARTGPRPPRLD